jgi:proteasome lid subunit RPN8/RPN11
LLLPFSQVCVGLFHIHPNILSSPSVNSASLGLGNPNWIPLILVDKGNKKKVVARSQQLSPFYFDKLEVAIYNMRLDPLVISGGIYR